MQALPATGINYQPRNALINVPVIFWSDQPASFNKTLYVLGVPVVIKTKPRNLWSFGDGGTLATTLSGGPYPNQDITHIYSAPGDYQIILTTTWSGTFTVEGVTQEIPGVIVKNSTAMLRVTGADTSFVHK